MKKTRNKDEGQRNKDNWDGQGQRAATNVLARKLEADPGPSLFVKGPGASARGQAGTQAGTEASARYKSWVLFESGPQPYRLKLKR